MPPLASHHHQYKQWLQGRRNPLCPPRPPLRRHRRNPSALPQLFVDINKLPCPPPTCDTRSRRGDVSAITTVVLDRDGCIVDRAAVAQAPHPPYQHPPLSPTTDDMQPSTASIQPRPWRLKPLWIDQFTALTKRIGASTSGLHAGAG